MAPRLAYPKSSPLVPALSSQSEKQKRASSVLPQRQKAQTARDCLEGVIVEGTRRRSSKCQSKDLPPKILKERKEINGHRSPGYNTIMMRKTLTAIYAQGVFRPLGPPDLPEQQRVMLIVSEVSPSSQEEDWLDVEC